MNPLCDRTEYLTMGEWKLLRCRPRDGQRRGPWRVWRNRKGGGWSVATHRTLVGTLIAAWKNRNYYPHSLYR